MKRPLRKPVRRWINKSRKWTSRLLGFFLFASAAFMDFLPGYSIYLYGKNDEINLETVSVLNEDRNESAFLELERMIDQEIEQTAKSSQNRVLLPAFAHRGYSAKYQENSFASFDGAIAEGCPQLELDVWQSADGVLYVSHDPSTGRLGVPDIDIETNLSDAIDAVITNNGEPVHRLQSVLDRYGENAVLLIELKSGISCVESFVRLLDQYPDIHNNILVQAWDTETLEALAAFYPYLYIQLLMPDLSLLEDVLGNDRIDGVAMSYSALNGDVLKQLHAAGKRVFVYTINDEQTMRNYISMGVDGIITDIPSLALSLFE